MKRFWSSIVGGCAVIASICARVMANASREDYIIVHGIRAYQRYITTMNVMLCLTIGAFVVTLFYNIAKNIAYKKANAMHQTLLEEQKQLELENKKHKDSYLSVSKMLKERVIRDHLKESYQGNWSCLKDELTPLYTQSVKMDEYQEKLKSLITKNDASVLDDTEDVLEQAEQSVLKNIRKVMNYMDVCNPTVTNEIEKVRNSALDCEKDNKVILDNVADFLMALTEYLNNQDSTDSLATLNAYKEAIRSSTEDTRDKVLVENKEQTKINTLVFGEVGK